MQCKAFHMLLLMICVTSLLTSMFISISNASGSSQKPIDDKIEQNYTFVKKWGGKGTGDGKFMRPHDLDFSPDEKILYAVDRDGNRIQAFDKNGTFLFAWGKLGKEDGLFHVPYGLDVDIEGNVWVVDRVNNRVKNLTIRVNLS